MVMMEHAVTALVVYESFFGNTQRIAHAVAEGLRLEGISPTVHEVSTADPADVVRFEALVVGGPTHAFGLSRESTRADAERRDGSAHRPGPGLRDWLGRLSAPRSSLAAAFDTRAEKVRHLPLSAAHTAARILARRGYTLVSKPTGFTVQDVEGPLSSGETERAVAWGRSLGQTIQLRRATAALDNPGSARRTP